MLTWWVNLLLRTLNRTVESPSDTVCCPGECLQRALRADGAQGPLSWGGNKPVTQVKG